MEKHSCLFTIPRRGHVTKWILYHLCVVVATWVAGDKNLSSRFSGFFAKFNPSVFLQSFSDAYSGFTPGGMGRGKDLVGLI